MSLEAAPLFAKDAGVHVAQIVGDRRLKVHVVEDVALEVGPRRLLDERQAALAQLEYRALGHVEDRLARAGCLRAGKGDLFDVAHEFVDLALGGDCATSLGELDIQPAGGERPGEYHVFGGGGDVDEAAASGHFAVEFRDVDVPVRVSLRQAEDRQVQAAAVIVVELLVHTDLGEHVVGMAEVLVVGGSPADSAGLGGQQGVVRNSFFGQDDPDVGRHAHPEVHDLTRTDLHGRAAGHHLADRQRQRLDIRDGNLNLTGKCRVVLGVLGLHVVVWLGDHDVIDEIAGNAHQVRVKRARFHHGLGLGDDDPARIMYGLGDGEDLHFQTFVFHRQIAHFVRVRTPNEADVDGEAAVIQVLFAVQLDE